LKYDETRKARQTWRIRGRKTASSHQREILEYLDFVKRPASLKRGVKRAIGLLLSRRKKKPAK